MIEFHINNCTAPGIWQWIKIVSVLKWLSTGKSFWLSVCDTCPSVSSEQTLHSLWQYLVHYNICPLVRILVNSDYFVIERVSFILVPQNLAQALANKVGKLQIFIETLMHKWNEWSVTLINQHLKNMNIHK